jgi:hypothetical protein
MSNLLSIPGIGKTFVKDFARIKIYCIDDLIGAKPEVLFEKLKQINLVEGHSTSKNYLYVIRLACYYANGGRDPEMLKWNKFKDSF